MKVSNNYIVVAQVEEPLKEGFDEVEVSDSSLFRGKVEILPECPVYIGNDQLTIGDIVLFSPYSPDTQNIVYKNESYKFISTRDILAKE